MSEGVWHCPSCGGLQLECDSADCRSATTLNRPFVRYCRRCKEDQAPEGPNRPGASDAWERARRSGWDRPCREFSEAELVADLGARKGYLPPEARVGMVMAQGVLALHTTHGRGDSMALLRPLAGDGVDPWIWHRDEPSTPPGRVAEVPFDPTLLPGGRHLAFARPGRLVLLDLWGCTGLSAYEESPPTSIRFDGAPLAAPPIPLSGSALGLLMVDGPSGYRWHVWSPGTPPPKPDELAGATALPLTGWPCQAELVDGRVLAMATPEGHWAWKVDDAVAARAVEIRPTWPGTDPAGDRRPVLDRQVLAPSDFREPRHAFRVNHPGTSQSFDWYARIEGRSASVDGGWVEYYDVNFATLRASKPVRYAPAGSARALPIGTTRTSPQSAQVLFRDGNKLRQEGSGDAKHWLAAPVDGVRWFDPLLVQVRTDDGGGRLVEAVPLRHPDYQAQAEVADLLVADPVLWSRWLFTAERDASHRVRIRRRALIEASP